MSEQSADKSARELFGDGETPSSPRQEFLDCDTGWPFDRRSIMRDKVIEQARFKLATQYDRLCPTTVIRCCEFD